MCGSLYILPQNTKDKLKYLGESLLTRTALFRGNCTDVRNNFEMHQKDKLMDRRKAHEQMMKYSKILMIEVVGL